MKFSIKNLIKSNRYVWMLYRRIGSSFLIMCARFIKVKKERILFMSFGGRQYSDSPKALYEAMKRDPFFANYEMAWAFNTPKEIGDIGCKKILIDSFAYFKYALSSRVWITNTSICRGLQFKRIDNICVNTWHGTPLKRMGASLDPNPKYKERVDIACCQNDMDREIFLRLFNIKKEDLMQVDLPRNDALFHYTEDKVENIRKTLGISKQKKVILYMPTYRDYNLDKQYNNYFLPPIDFKNGKSI